MQAPAVAPRCSRAPRAALPCLPPARVHRKYRTGTRFDYDIALLFLDEPSTKAVINLPGYIGAPRGGRQAACAGGWVGRAWMHGPNTNGRCVLGSALQPGTAAAAVHHAR